MDLRERRLLLHAEPNPDRRIDYVCSLGTNVDAIVAGSTLQITLRYVPDRVILTPASLNDYLDKISILEWPSLEDFAVTVLNDINDELIARWIEVSLAANTKGIRHDVVLSEQQPDWEDQGILSRLPAP